MQNKKTLLDIIDFAERGAILSGEAQILRDAIELLDDMSTTMESMLADHAELAT